MKSKLDPIIAVKDVVASSKWYQQIFNCKSAHGGTQFDVLIDENNEVLICLHPWNAHEHPTMQRPEITPGNGLLMYLRTEHMQRIRQNVEKMNWPVEEEIHLNKNSLRNEFSFRDPDGYYWSVTDHHIYEG